MTWWAWLFCIAPLRATAQVLDICQQFQSQHGNITTIPGKPHYNALAEEDWSQTAWADPLCIVQPSDAPQMQNIVRILSTHDIPFAIRSGGHLPSPLGANINYGVLIDLSGFRVLDYDAATELVTIGTGLRWQAVYEALAQYGRTAVGGRLLDVGVGGFMLGSMVYSSYRTDNSWHKSLTTEVGGLSYLSDLYGLGCDNVVNFQAILASGALVNANATSNPELFWALKGGGNNFGKTHLCQALDRQN
jgi:FAD/FMN-containing dehydrogenase